MTAVDGEVKEADVSRGLPIVAQALLPICCLGGLTDGCGGDKNPEKESQLPGQKLAATLLEDMQLRQ